MNKITIDLSRIYVITKLSEIAETTISALVIKSITRMSVNRPPSSFYERHERTLISTLVAYTLYPLSDFTTAL